MTERCAGCVVDEGRRAFIARSALAAIGTLVLNACGDGEIGGPLGSSAKPLADPLVIVVGNFPALATIGGTARVDAGTPWPVAVTRTGAASFVALSMICTHQAFRPIQITLSGFQCPNHGALFDPFGDHVGGQPTTNLRTYQSVYEVATDTLTII